jgi:hypothetical protein
MASERFALSFWWFRLFALLAVCRWCWAVEMHTAPMWLVSTQQLPPAKALAADDGYLKVMHVHALHQQQGILPRRNR